MFADKCQLLHDQYLQYQCLENQCLENDAASAGRLRGLGVDFLGVDMGEFLEIRILIRLLQHSHKLVV